MARGAACLGHGGAETANTRAGKTGELPLQDQAAGTCRGKRALKKKKEKKENAPSLNQNNLFL